MLDEAIVIYYICDEVWKIFGLQDDSQCKMTSPEVMAFSIISALYYGCNYQRTRLISNVLRYFPKILSLSQLVRRIHRIPEQIWVMIFAALQLFLRDESKKTFIIDSFPVAAYQNHKSFRARIFNTKEYHGYTASKKQYFFGIKVHMIVDIDGVPIEFLFTPGSTSDVSALQFFDMNISEGSQILGDRAYTSYYFEDALLQLKKIHLIPKRKTCHKRQHCLEKNDLIKKYRNRIETVFSSIVSRMPRQIKARCEKGFCLKVLFLILAYMVALFCPSR
jgi:hypothetical protein